MIGPARGSHNGLVEAAKRMAAVVIAEQVKLVAKGADDLVTAAWWWLSDVGLNPVVKSAIEDGESMAAASITIRC